MKIIAPLFRLRAFNLASQRLFAFSPSSNTGFSRNPIGACAV